MKPVYKGSDYWYEWLVSQSRTDHIYDLIHNDIPSGFDLNHEGDFVVIDLITLPEDLKPVPSTHLSAENNILQFEIKEACLLISNNFLTDYLEAAKQVLIINSKNDRSFFKLVFTRPEYEDSDEDDNESNLWEDPF